MMSASNLDQTNFSLDTLNLDTLKAMQSLRAQFTLPRHTIKHYV